MESNYNIIREQLIIQWPEHVTYLAKLEKALSVNSLKAVEEIAKKIRKIAGENLNEYIASYRVICEIMNKERLYFLRSKKYRNSSLSEVNKEVYSNQEYMRTYMRGLLVSQLFWSNHINSYIFYKKFISSLPRNYSYLEIGPGHGLYLAIAAEDINCANIEAIDISKESLIQTQASLSVFGVERAVKLTQHDVCDPSFNIAPHTFYDVIVISEVLEHLENPKIVLENIKKCLSTDGKILINVPLNSPAPDHIFYLGSLEDVRSLVESAGLEILKIEAFPLTGYSLEEAMAQSLTVSCSLIAQKVSN